MTMTKERFREVLANPWTTRENRIITEESSRYKHSLPLGVRPHRQEMAEFCMPKLPGRTLSSVENHLFVLRLWLPRRNSKPKGRRSKSRYDAENRSRIAATEKRWGIARKLQPGKVRATKVIQCPGCGLQSEVV